MVILTDATFAQQTSLKTVGINKFTPNGLRPARIENGFVVALDSGFVIIH